MFDRHEITVLKSYVTGLLHLIEHRTASYVPVAVRPGHEVRVPTSPSEDPRLVAILEDEVGVDEPDWVLTTSESPLLLRAHRLLGLMESTLPQTDCVVHLRSQDEAEVWLQCIQYFLSSISGAADADGMVKGVDTIPTITWLSGIATSLRLAVERAVMA